MSEVCAQQPRRQTAQEGETTPALSGQELARVTFRMGLLCRRGLAAANAEVMALRLTLRDRDRDDRRSCLECSNLQIFRGHMTCAALAAARNARRAVNNVDGPVQPLMDGTLHRCRSFEWQTPN